MKITLQQIDETLNSDSLYFSVKSFLVYFSMLHICNPNEVSVRCKTSTRSMSWRMKKWQGEDECKKKIKMKNNLFLRGQVLNFSRNF